MYKFYNDTTWRVHHIKPQSQIGYTDVGLENN